MTNSSKFKAFISKICNLVANLVLILFFISGICNLVLNSVYADENATEFYISELFVLPKMPEPGKYADFSVYFGNDGDITSNEYRVAVSFDKDILKNISLGETEACSYSDNTMLCDFASMDPGGFHSLGFRGVIADGFSGENILATAVIEEKDSTDTNKENNAFELVFSIGGPKYGADIMAMGETIRRDPVSELTRPEEPLIRQEVGMLDVADIPEWKVNSLTTMGLKFMIRGKEALAWILGIQDFGFRQDAIQSIYSKVLTVVNSLFILGLLAIALMWIFSILIPRSYLRKVILVFALAVIFVNFALPLNQLFIDGANLLQRTFMGNVNITDIVGTPSYNDTASIGYINTADSMSETKSKTIRFDITQEASEQNNITPPGFVDVGTIEDDVPSELGPSYMGSIMFPVFDEEGKVARVEEETIQLRATADQTLKLKPGQTMELSGENSLDPNAENSIFIFAILLFTGIAYFGMALVFLLRIVILWALLIISPILFLLAIFESTRSYFYNWLGFYARWLLIGPLMALGIAITVGIWQIAGLPVVSAYTGAGEFGLLSNIGFYLPGKDTINTLETTPQMMEYMLFLVMLYLPILFAFALTRQKLWIKTAEAMAKQRAERTGGAISVVAQGAQGAPAMAGAAEGGQAMTKTEQLGQSAKTLAGGIKGFLETKLAGINKVSTELPPDMRSTERQKAFHPEAAISTLPEHLTMTSMRDMIQMASGNEGSSRTARQRAINIIADPAGITNTREREKVTAIRNEIEERTERGDGEAIRFMGEVRNIEIAKTEANGSQEIRVDLKPAPESIQTKKTEVQIPKTEIPSAKPEKLSRKPKEPPEDEDEDEDNKSQITNHE